jgi:hypothetical protein
LGHFVPFKICWMGQYYEIGVSLYIIKFQLNVSLSCYLLSHNSKLPHTLKREKCHLNNRVQFLFILKIYLKEVGKSGTSRCVKKLWGVNTWGDAQPIY